MSKNLEDEKEKLKQEKLHFDGQKEEYEEAVEQEKEEAKDYAELEQEYNDGMWDNCDYEDEKEDY